MRPNFNYVFPTALKVSRWLIIIAALFLSTVRMSAQTDQAVDENGIYYSIITPDGNEVNVSVLNKDKTGMSPTGVVIPKTFTDRSDTGTGKTYTVVGISSQAFQNCAWVTSVTIDADVPEISANAFSGCTALTTVTINGSVPAIGQSAFKDCTALTSISGEGYENVTAIKSSAFENCSALRGIHLPPALSVMGGSAFANCTSLETITLPGSLGENTGASAFFGCTGLREVIINEGVAKLANNMFQRCSSLAAPAFPSTITKVEASCFSECTSLGDLTIYGGVTYGGNAYADSRITSLSWPERAFVPGTSMFKNCAGITDVDLPGYIETIPNSMFSNCPDLVTVKLNSGIKNIGGSAFYVCPNLTTLTLPSTLEVINSQAFTSCTALTDFDLPASLKTIGQHSFSNCTSLQHITLPGGAALGVSAFAGTKLLSITFPDEPLASYSKSSFGSQTYITEFTVKGWMNDMPKDFLSFWNNLENLIIEEGVEQLPEGFASNCPQLSSVSLPSSLRTIGIRSFAGTGSLKQISLPEGLVTIGENAFQSSGLESVIFPSTLTSLGAGSFKNSALLSVVFPSHLTSIPNNCFSGCSSLSSVTLGETLQEIGDQAFSNCSALTTIDFPAGLKSIGKDAFFKTGLTEVSLPAGVHVGDEAFRQSAITAINFPSEPCTFGNNCFQHIGVTSIDLPDWMTTVPPGFLQQCSKLTTLTLHEGLTEIGDNAFQGCILLHDVDFPSTLINIGEYAFSSCGIISSSNRIKFGRVVLSEGVTIGDNAFNGTTVTEIVFRGCPANFGNDIFKAVSTITNIVFPECLTEIPAGFCNNWTELASVTLGPNVSSIGDQAFLNCSKLTTVKYQGLPEGIPTEGIMNLPPTLLSIGKAAFKNTAFTSINWPEQKIEIAAEAFSNSKLTSLEIPRWMSPIPDKCFYSSKNLATLTWEPREGEYATPLAVGNEAFSYSIISEINLPDVETTYGNSVFGNCSKATHINWPSKKQTFNGYFTFGQCSNLLSVELPDYMTSLPERCFEQCTRLATVDMGKGLTSCGKGCFQQSGVESIVWSPEITTLGENCFKDCKKLISVDVPGTIAIIPRNCFYNCTNLTNLTLAEGITKIDSGAFQNDNISTLTTPSTLRFINSGAFSYNRGMTALTLNEGLELIDLGAFAYCESLKEVVIPSTVQSVVTDNDKKQRYLQITYAGVSNGAFRYCSSLEKVTILSPFITIPDQCFENCPKLSSFISQGDIYAIGSSAFHGDAMLSEFSFQGDDNIAFICANAFNGCSSLTEFPFMHNTCVSGNAFQDCTSLKQLVMPEASHWGKNTGDFNIAGPNVIGRNFAKGCTSLQSVIFPGTSPYFFLQGGDLADAPLKALSFCNATDISVGHNNKPMTLVKYNNSGASVRAEKPKLIVRRGQKWKFFEQGYNQFFDIIEQREPQAVLEGFIKSTFIPEENKNLYTAVLRWEAPLSDLNPDGPTKVTVYRDNTPVGTMEFSQPRLETQEGRQVYAVDVKVNGTSQGTELDYFCPATQSGKYEIYETQRISNGSTIYFDAESEKRLGAIEKWGYESWMAIRDEFKSPSLDNPEEVPLSYEYHAVIDGFPYSVLVNNDNLEEGADGLLYHTETRNSSQLAPQKVTLSTMMAVPSLDLSASFTTAQIMQDTDFRLAVSDASKFNKIAYAMDPSLVLKKYTQINGTTAWVITSVDLYQAADPHVRTAADSDLKLASKEINGNYASSSITIPAGADPQPGKRYQTILHSPAFGDFGSPVITLPEMPTIDATISVNTTEHMYADPMAHIYDGVGQLPVTATLTIENIDASGMGYPEGTPARENWEIGIKRKIATTLKSSGRAAASAAPDREELVFHPAADATTNFLATNCHICKANDGIFTETDGDGRQITRFVDTYDIPGDRDHTATYTPRVYVKVPRSYNPGEDRWLLAQTEVEGAKLTVTGLENVLAGSDADEGRVRYFDLNGFDVSEPAEGNIYIKVTASGSEKIVY